MRRTYQLTLSIALLGAPLAAWEDRAVGTHKAQIDHEARDAICTDIKGFYLGIGAGAPNYNDSSIFKDGHL